MPREPMQAPRASTAGSAASTATLLRRPASRTMPRTTTWPLATSGTSCSRRRRSSWGCDRDTTTTASWLRRRQEDAHVAGAQVPDRARAGVDDGVDHLAAAQRRLAQHPVLAGLSESRGHRVAGGLGGLAREVGDVARERSLLPARAGAVQAAGAGGEVDAGVDGAVAAGQPAVGVDEGGLEEPGEAFVAQLRVLAEAGDGGVEVPWARAAHVTRVAHVRCRRRCGRR